MRPLRLLTYSSVMILSLMIAVSNFAFGDEEQTRDILKQGLLGAGVGAISAGASGGKAGQGALIGAGGLDVAVALGGGPWYVVKMDVKKNVIYISRDQKKLLSKELTAEKVSWIAGAAPKLPIRVKVKIRYKHKEAPCLIRKIKNNFKIIFDKPQRAVTAGQSAVFYRGDEALGGGVIK